MQTKKGFSNDLNSDSIFEEKKIK